MPAEIEHEMMAEISVELVEKENQVETSLVQEHPVQSDKQSYCCPQNIEIENCSAADERPLSKLQQRKIELAQCIEQHNIPVAENWEESSESLMF
jgi:hypothetical protein